MDKNTISRLTTISFHQTMETMNCQHQPISSPDNLSASGVRKHCQNKCFGHVHFVHKDKTDSTNDDARKLILEGAPHGTLVVAETQTKGRGRHNRNWTSPTNAGIYTSLILRPQRPLQKATLLSLVTAIATVEAITQTTHAKPQIKWPNDILLHQHKIAGILTETEILPDKDYALIIGLGINVNTPFAALPKRILFPSSSIQRETGHSVSRALLLAKWLERMEIWYQKWENKKAADILGHWHEYAYGLGKALSIQQEGKTITGIMQGIAEDGSLILQGPTGEIVRITAGDVTATRFDQG